MSILRRIKALLPFQDPPATTHSSRRSVQDETSIREIFSTIVSNHEWGEDESVCGPGSGLNRTSVFRDEIVQLLEQLGTRSLLDAACGDFNWMKELALDNVAYVGIDILPELVHTNQQKYRNDRRSFFNLDITSDELPRADVILCRDCLVHFSYKHIFAAIRNFKRSGAAYLLTTSFVRLAANTDVRTGGWRTINLQREPFNFPAPLAAIDERCTHSGGVYSDKHLAMWRISDIPDFP